MEAEINTLRLSIRKKFLFSLVTFCLFLLVFEVLLRLTDNWHELGRNQLKQSYLASSGRSEDSAREVLHPYFGWTYDPNTDGGITARKRLFAVNEFGFPDDSTSLAKKEEGKINIAVFGGSFAMEFGLFSGDRFVELLKLGPKFKEYDINLVRLGMSGMKQPQQTMILSYMLALGAEYDYVINLDGFNEGVLPSLYNMNVGIHYAHPFGWNARLQDLIDPKTTSLSYRLLTNRAKRQMLAQNLIESPFRQLLIRQLIWSLQDELLANEKYTLESELRNVRPLNERQHAIRGPLTTDVESEELYRDSAELWMNCSEQMHVLCENRGIIYLHLLQPNQYVPESKVFTQEEVSKWAMSQDDPWSLYSQASDYQQSVLESYPLLFERGQHLESIGVRFIDLTQIFSKEKRTIYRDGCCHLNELGYDLIARTIAEEILRVSNNTDRTN